jgi:hypothetical protein
MVKAFFKNSNPFYLLLSSTNDLLSYKPAAAMASKKKSY